MPTLRLSLLGATPSSPTPRHFHVRKDGRDELKLAEDLFSIRGDVIFADVWQAHLFTDALNKKYGTLVPASQINAMGLIHEICHAVIDVYRKQVKGQVFRELRDHLAARLGDELDRTVLEFAASVPPPAVYRGEQTPAEYAAGRSDGVSNVEWLLEEMFLHWLSNQNPGYAPITRLIDDQPLRHQTAYPAVISTLCEFFAAQPKFGARNQSLVDLLLAPIRHSPNSLMGQLDYMRMNWGLDLEAFGFWRRLLLGMDFIREEGKWFQRKSHGVGAEDSLTPPSFRGDLYEEPEAFSTDLHWMPKVVMIAKSTFVWLDQLSKRYRRDIRLLSDIPDEELDTLAGRGFTGLWLIGVWRRSEASRRIKHISGNQDAVASAYSLHDYEIAPELGGEPAYKSLKDRAMRRGIRLASDMVPNHMGIDSTWVVNHPDWFIQSNHPPFPNYSYNGPDLSSDERVGVFIEDGYWTHRDAAVSFKRVDRWTGDARFLYHGNDGTSMPWNDTAQLNYLMPEVREAVIQQILRVARMFPIIRFDAAMTLAKKHFQRLWFPLPGSGGDIPSRAAHAMTREEFDRAIPIEFWREVVDRVAAEVPDTLLLAEAFWLMEGYFVRTLGMHRVYNSAFMNMMKREENANYRTTIRNVLEFNPQVLKRFVNFMNNPDEETAVAQFGKDDKYFGVCVVMATMPGLPMFGHGQIEGFTEKYGMEFKRAMWDEQPDGWLVGRHEREIFPVLKRRWLFADVDHFYLYDCVTPEGWVDEDVFAYSNRVGHEKGLVVFHNKYKHTRVRVAGSVGFLGPSGGIERRSFAEGLGIDGAPGRYVVFRDSISGLEYLREGRRLVEGGLELELGAFKYHVFVDFREVTDSAETPWAKLAGELGGRGVASIDDALVDLVHRSVHLPLYEAINPGSVVYLGTAWDARAKAPRAEVLAVAGKKLRDIRDGVAYRTQGQVALAEETVTALAHRVELAAESAKARPGRPGGPSPLHVYLAWLYADATRALRALADPEATAATFDAWRLDHVLLRVFREAGLGPDDAGRAAEVCRFLLDLEPGEAAQMTPRALLLRLFTDPAVERLLQVNRFEGTVWFNKEAFSDFVACVHLFGVVEAVAGGEDDPAALDQSAIALLEEAEGSGYRFEKLRAAVFTAAEAEASAPTREE